MISILCVTQAAPYARAFIHEMGWLSWALDAQLVVAIDKKNIREFNIARAALASDYPARFIAVQSKGFIESVLDEAVAACDARYVLRLDDDERCSTAMFEWLEDRKYESSDHWKFPRVHLWGAGVLMTPQLFPDWQTRLSIRRKAGGRHTLHAGSPFGGGTEAPVAIEHHKFLVRSYAEREVTSKAWHNGNMIAFSLPEIANEGQFVKLVEFGKGEVPWIPSWTRDITL